MPYLRIVANPYIYSIFSSRMTHVHARFLQAHLEVLTLPLYGTASWNFRASKMSTIYDCGRYPWTKSRSLFIWPSVRQYWCLCCCVEIYIVLIWFKKVIKWTRSLGIVMMFWNFIKTGFHRRKIENFYFLFIRWKRIDSKSSIEFAFLRTRL